MKFLLWFVIALVGVIVIFVCGFIALVIRAQRVSAKRDRELDTLLEPALSFLSDGSEPDMGLIRSLAENPKLRNRLFAKLNASGKSALFPEEYRELSKIAESDLARWLSHGNELGCAPSAIELMHSSKVEEEGRFGVVFLFRFRVSSDHWAADKDWMAGVSGPFWDDDELPDSGGSTFSELESYSGRTTEEHIEFLSSAAVRYGWVMPIPLELGHNPR